MEPDVTSPPTEVPATKVTQPAIAVSLPDMIVPSVTLPAEETVLIVDEVKIADETAVEHEISASSRSEVIPEVPSTGSAENIVPVQPPADNGIPTPDQLVGSIREERVTKRYTIDELRAASGRKKLKREKRLEEIVIFAKNYGGVTRDDIIKLYNVSPQAARGYTRALTRRGVLKKKVQVVYEVSA